MVVAVMTVFGMAMIGNCTVGMPNAAVRQVGVVVPVLINGHEFGWPCAK